MRILVATTWFPTPGHPAVGAFVARDVAALAARHDVRVLHLVAPPLATGLAGLDDDGSWERVALDLPGIAPVGVPVRRLVTDLKRPDHLVRAGRAIRGAARGADVLHTAVFSTLLGLAGRRVEVPWVHTEHWHGVTSTAGDSPLVRAVTPPLRALLLRPDVVTAVSELATAPVRALRGARPTLVVPCIVAPAAPVPPRREAGDVLRLVAVGGLVAGKRPLLAVETLAALRERGRRAELTWVGDGPLRGAVEARAAELAVPVHLPGELDASGVAAALARADVFVLPTRRETFGVAIAEALAHGRPVVVGIDGGFRDFVDPRVGAFVAGEDPSAWADAVDDVLARTADLDADEIAATLGNRFTPETVVAGYEAAYAHAGAPQGGEPGAPQGVDAARRDPGPVSPGSADRAGSPRAAEPRSAAPGGGTEPFVDVIVGVHSTSRPVARAVTSVLANATPVRVTVVCHDLPAAQVARVLADVPARARALGHEVRLVEHADGVRSPAGPYNRGLDEASAPYVSVLGSDDRLAPGAIDSWVALARRADADAVIPCLAFARPDGSVRAVVPTPPARPFRSTGLDPVRDRLAYRSAPLGLLRRATLERLGLRHDEGKPVGVDLELSTRLWFEAERIAFDRRGPAYLIGEDGPDRITMAHRALDQDLAWLPGMLEARWFRVMPPRRRRALAVKIMRIHLFGAIHYRPEPSTWTARERETLRNVTLEVLTAAPDAERVLSRAEHDLLDAALDPAVPAERLVALSARRRRHGTPATLVPRDPRFLLAREAPLRFMAASVLTQF